MMAGRRLVRRSSRSADIPFRRTAATAASPNPSSQSQTLTSRAGRALARSAAAPELGDAARANREALPCQRMTGAKASEQIQGKDRRSPRQGGLPGLLRISPKLVDMDMQGCSFYSVSDGEEQLEDESGREPRYRADR